MDYVELPDSIEGIEEMYASPCGKGVGMKECAINLDLNYFKIRDFLTILVNRGNLDELDTQMEQQTSLRYIMFIKDNFKNLCEGSSLKPGFGSVELYRKHTDLDGDVFGLRKLASTS